MKKSRLFFSLLLLSGCSSHVDVGMGGSSSDQGTTSTIASQNCTPPATPVSNFAAATASSSQINLSWSSNLNSCITGFLIQYSTSSTFTTFLSTANLPTSDTSASVTGLLANKTYYFRILVNYAENTQSSAWLSTIAGDTATALPAAPSNPFLSSSDVTSDVNYSINVTSWTDNSPNESSFVVRYSTDAGFTTFTDVNVLPDSAQPSVSLQLSYGTNYYIKVAARNHLGTSAFTAPITFFTNYYFGPPVSLVFSGITSSQITVSWTYPSNPNIISYSLQYALDAAFSSPTLISDIPSTTKTVTGLIANKTYYFRARSNTSAQSSGWSAIGSAQTPCSSSGCGSGNNL